MKKVALSAFICLIIGVIGSVIYGKQLITVTKGEKVTETKEIDAKDIENIIVNVDVADLHVLPSDGDKITVKLNTTKQPIDDMEFEVKENDKVLNVTLKTQKESNFGFNFSLGSFINTGSVDLYLSLPEKVYEQIEVTSDVGDIQIGNVNVSDLYTTSDVGDTELDQVTSENAKLISNVGDVEVTQGQGAYHVETDTGEIELNLLKLSKDTYLKSDIGDVLVSIIEKPKDMVLDLKSDIGDVEVSNFEGVGRSTGNDLYVELGNNGPKLQVVTDIGEIDVK
ncbi:DUF4097 family beta strand repeat-containing protein [Aquibacillus kalidii]|uniref:DUF4097 family beta strand repeat-containing protein n=1 Tax=Aquibacillus kalidii TaxID=2762597 RepID=UPI0016447AA4|nr:DUF4097 family beta strand repeat-containing protein [Aquibacillus kalidii]